ncbi:MAG: hypothetical protein Q4B73_07665 [Lachnospiraceae bacterium]|nr:hypothetical protein [Lachnospiraceae bacterium]
MPASFFMPTDPSVTPATMGLKHRCAAVRRIITVTPATMGLKNEPALSRLIF